MRICCLAQSLGTEMRTPSKDAPSSVRTHVTTGLSRVCFSHWVQRPSLSSGLDISLVVHSTVYSSELGWEALQAGGHPLLTSRAVNGYRLGRSSGPSRAARVPATLRMSTLSSLEPDALLPTATEGHVLFWVSRPFSSQAIPLFFCNLLPEFSTLSPSSVTRVTWSCLAWHWLKV